MKTDLWGTYQVLSEAECDRIHHGSLKVLRDVGVYLPNERLLSLVEAAGARVEWNAQRVRFPPTLVEGAIEAKRKAAGGAAIPRRQPGRHVRGSFTGYATRVVDMDTGVVRAATYRDLQDSVRIANVLECVDTCGHLIVPRDVPDGMEDVYQYYGTAQVCTKPFAPYILHRSSVRPLLEMAIVVEGSEQAVRQRGRFAYHAYCHSPLRYPRDVLEIAWDVYELGFPVSFGGPMAIAGATAPVTLAGAVLLANAEALSGLVIGQALGLPGHYNGSVVVMDVRTGMACYADPRKVVACMALRDMARHYGLPHPTFHVGVDACVPGIQASAERMFSAMLTLFLWDSTPVVRLGILGPSGSVCSLPSVVADAELVDLLNALLQGIEVTEETLALDLIEQVGPGGHFLDQDHTAQHFRTELWLPQFFQRRLPRSDGFPDRENLLDRATARVREILQQEVPTPLSTAQRGELDEILTHAKQAGRKKP